MYRINAFLLTVSLSVLCQCIQSFSVLATSEECEDEYNASSPPSTLVVNLDNLFNEDDDDKKEEAHESQEQHEQQKNLRALFDHEPNPLERVALFLQLKPFYADNKKLFSEQFIENPNPKNSNFVVSAIDTILNAFKYHKDYQQYRINSFSKVIESPNMSFYAQVEALKIIHKEDPDLAVNLSFKKLEALSSDKYFSDFFTLENLLQNVFKHQEAKEKALRLVGKIAENFQGKKIASEIWQTAFSLGINFEDIFNECLKNINGFEDNHQNPAKFFLIIKLMKTCENKMIFISDSLSSRLKESLKEIMKDNSIRFNIRCEAAEMMFKLNPLWDKEFVEIMEKFVDSDQADNKNGILQSVVWAYSLAKEKTPDAQEFEKKFNSLLIQIMENKQSSDHRRLAAAETVLNFYPESTNTCIPVLKEMNPVSFDDGEKLCLALLLLKCRQPLNLDLISPNQYDDNLFFLKELIPTILSRSEDQALVEKISPEWVEDITKESTEKFENFFLVGNVLKESKLYNAHLINFFLEEAFSSSILEHAYFVGLSERYQEPARTFFKSKWTPSLEKERRYPLINLLLGLGASMQKEWENDLIEALKEGDLMVRIPCVESLIKYGEKREAIAEALYTLINELIPSNGYVSMRLINKLASFDGQKEKTEILLNTLANQKGNQEIKKNALDELNSLIESGELNFDSEHPAIQKMHTDVG